MDQVLTTPGHTTEELQRLLEEQHKGARLLIRRDLELTRANEKLQELDQKKSEFITIVAHQLRTPLTGMKWTLNMLVKGDLGPFSEEQKSSLIQLAENNDRLISLVEKILSANQLDMAKYELITSDVDIISIIKEVIFSNNAHAKAKRVSIEFQPEITSLIMRLDKEKIREVFENLIDNAVRYSRVAGKVSISLSKKEGVLECIVEDNGIGLPPDQANQIFSRFFRGRNAKEAEPDGTGLGLFIVKGIIELHGGKMSFESKENQGTTFYFTIPIKT